MVKIGGTVVAKVDIFTIKGALLTFDDIKKHHYQHFYIGKGSNFVYRDQYPQPTIAINLCAKHYYLKEDILYVEAGISLSFLARKLSQSGYQGWSGLEDIPGTLAGALINNSGAFHQTISDYLLDLLFITPDGEILIVKKEDMEYASRSSKVKNRPLGLLFSARFSLKKGDYHEIQRQEKEYHEYRIAHQPHGVMSLGSTFKNGDHYYAGQIIEQAGLKGFHSEHIAISDKHANFLIFQKGATAHELLEFVATIQKIVYNKYTILLELEIAIQGGEDNG